MFYYSPLPPDAPKAIGLFSVETGNEDLVLLAAAAAVLVAAADLAVALRSSITSSTCTVAVAAAAAAVVVVVAVSSFLSCWCCRCLNVVVVDGFRDCRGLVVVGAKEAPSNEIGAGAGGLEEAGGITAAHFIKWGCDIGCCRIDTDVDVSVAVTVRSLVTGFEGV
jgi:hypothetical protein